MSINGVIEDTNSSINTSITNQFTKSLSAGNYNWKVFCVDLAGNSNETENRTITINAVPPSSGGGGSSRTTTTSKEETISDLELKEGTTKNLRKNDKLLFSINNTNHTLTLYELGVYSIIITIQSDPIDLFLSLNETRRVDLNYDNYYDLEIKLNSLESSRANLTIREISEQIPSREIFNGEEGILEDEFLEEKNENNIIVIIVVAIALILVTTLISLFIRKRKEKNIQNLKNRYMKPVTSKRL